MTESTLRTWRKRHGLTQEGAARLADVTLGTWRQWEGGHVVGPNLSALRLLEAVHPGLAAMLLPIGKVRR